MLNEIRGDMLEVKRKISEVEIVIGKREGETELVNKLIDAENLLTYCMSRLENAIVPPLNIDDYVYQYNDTLKEIHGYRIEQVNYYGKIFNSGFSYQAICKPNGVVIRFSELDIGKTIFLTRKEAEQALAERKSDNGHP